MKYYILTFEGFVNNIKLEEPFFIGNTPKLSVMLSKEKIINYLKKLNPTATSVDASLIKKEEVDKAAYAEKSSSFIQLP